MLTSSPYGHVKRGLDVLLATVGLVLCSPLLLAIAAAVKLSSPGPALFRQERVGLFGRRFVLLKFRSMRTGASGPGVTSAGDSRITPVGKLLRKYKMDELPQLINIVKGDMSIVGPRPELPRYVDRFPNPYEEILTVRPGLTDYAALEFRNEEEILAQSGDPENAYVSVVLPRKIELYRKYLREMSLATDASLVLKTILAIVQP